MPTVSWMLLPLTLSVMVPPPTPDAWSTRMLRCQPPEISLPVIELVPRIVSNEIEPSLNGVASFVPLVPSMRRFVNVRFVVWFPRMP